MSAWSFSRLRWLIFVLMAGREFSIIAWTSKQAHTKNLQVCKFWWFCLFEIPLSDVSAPRLTLCDKHLAVCHCHCYSGIVWDPFYQFETVFSLCMLWLDFPGNSKHLFWETKDDMSTICVLPSDKSAKLTRVQSLLLSQWFQITPTKAITCAEMFPSILNLKHTACIFLDQIYGNKKDLLKKISLWFYLSLWLKARSWSRSCILRKPPIPTFKFGKRCKIGVAKFQITFRPTGPPCPPPPPPHHHHPTPPTWPHPARHRAAKPSPPGHPASNPEVLMLCNVWAVYYFSFFMENGNSMDLVVTGQSSSRHFAQSCDHLLVSEHGNKSWPTIVCSKNQWKR